MEFSYDSRNRAEVARESGNIVNICATVLPSVGHDHELFLKKKQSAAVQLELPFLFEQTEWWTAWQNQEALHADGRQQKTARRRFRAK
ncbi:hypothetical protein [Paraburkholderia sp. BL25I1N1]|uniref:hypothetical protein n=1 Tax=Paraburkholderia sp. BL25I1N1 TaxID=1938804 RepID=UPI0011B2204E|nr:hypothetical protein [Paraburkholderia sp. BL25I1N1]